MEILCGKRKYKFKDEAIRMPPSKDNTKHPKWKGGASIPLNFRLEMAGMVGEKGMMSDLYGYKEDQEFEPISDN